MNEVAEIDATIEAVDSETHWRKVFNSPYLSSADIVAPMTFTIDWVTDETDKAGKKSIRHNTAHFVEDEIRPGEKLKPMILNVQNCKVMAEICGTPYIAKWTNVRVTIFVEHGVKFGPDVVSGLRLRLADETINNIQVQHLQALVKEVGADEGRFLGWCKSGSIGEIDSGKYDRCVKRLEGMR